MRNIALVILTISMVSVVKPVSAQTRHNNHIDPNATCMAPFCARYHPTRYNRYNATRYNNDNNYNDPNATCMAPPFCSRYFGNSEAK
jgi:hypothetical protein